MLWQQTPRALERVLYVHECGPMHLWTLERRARLQPLLNARSAASSYNQLEHYGRVRSAADLVSMKCSGEPKFGA